MAADRTEEEQVEALKKWFEENGVSLVVGIVLSLGAVFGYRAWENNVRETGEAASAIYQDLTSAVQIQAPTEEQSKTGETLAQTLKDEYPDSAYAMFGAFHMAKIAADNSDYERAEKELRWALEHGAKDSFEIITRIRLARALGAQDKHEDALGVLTTKTDLGGHLATWQELKGDLLNALDRKDEARQAYQLAVNSLAADNPKPYLSMKLENLIFAAPTNREGAKSDGDAEAAQSEEPAAGES